MRSSPALLVKVSCRYRGSRSRLRWRRVQSLYLLNISSLSWLFLWCLTGRSVSASLLPARTYPVSSAPRSSCSCSSVYQDVPCLTPFPQSQYLKLHLVCLLVFTLKPRQPRLKRPTNLFRQLSTRPWLHAVGVDLLTVPTSRLLVTAAPSLGDIG